MASTWTLLDRSACGQTVNLIPIRNVPQAITQYDETTQWALQLKPDAVIHSPLLRLRDIAIPIEPNPPWWDRAGASIVGLMPLHEREMTVDRNRLMEAVAKSTSTPNIQWSGADEIRVVFRREIVKNPAVVQTVSAQQELQPTSISSESTVSMTPIVPIPAVVPAMTPSERDRITRLVQIGIDRYDNQLREAFDIEVDPTQMGIETLRDFRRVDSVSWDTPPTEGWNQATVKGMNSREAVTAIIEVSFTARPLVVVPRDSLRKGHILSESDLTLMPAARNVSISDVITDMSEAVGLQVQTVIQKDRPLSRSMVGPVIIMQRGDLVEVRVVGGGVTVATGAKTLAPGAKGDLIAIETLEPRRKLMARVAGPGIVEIITRPPRVQ